MWHVDEGTLHALADGELETVAGERSAQVEAHLAVCAECAARLEEVRRFRSAARAILRSASPETADPPPFEAILARARADAPGGALRPRRPAPRTLAWAASIAIAVGAGWFARAALTPNPAAPIRAAVPPHQAERPMADVARAPGSGTAAAGRARVADAAIAARQAGPEDPRAAGAAVEAFVDGGAASAGDRTASVPAPRDPSVDRGPQGSIVATGEAAPNVDPPPAPVARTLAARPPEPVSSIRAPRPAPAPGRQAESAEPGAAALERARAAGAAAPEFAALQRADRARSAAPPAVLADRAAAADGAGRDAALAGDARKGAVAPQAAGADRQAPAAAPEPPTKEDAPWRGLITGAVAAVANAVADRAASDAVEAVAPRRVRGHVLEVGNGAALVGARVLLIGKDGEPVHSAETDLDGYFEFRDVPPGRYHIAAERDGYEMPLRTIEVEAHGDVVVELRVRPVRP
ncbi:MAG TPA: carboxypeptidase regulatory-like domain-containing protein [Longimicrobiales bacterium]